MPQPSIGLADAIDALRRELGAALVTGAGEPIQFGLKSIELTLELAVTWVAEGKVGWTVLSAGGSRASETTQSLTLSLDPKLITPTGVTTGLNISDALSVDDTVGRSSPLADQ